VRLAGSELEATFAPEAGMVCHSLRHRGEELLGQRDGLEAYARTGKTMGIPFLHPWANRLGAWSYTALGRSVDLHGTPVRADAGTGLPMHGTLPRPWRVLRAGVAELDGASDAFPFEHTVRLEVEVGDVLRITTTIEAHDGPVPVSFGFHPFLLIPGVPRGRWHVELPVTRRRDFPSGDTEPVEPYSGPLGERAYDDGYDERARGPFVVAGGRRRIEVHFEAGFPFAQVFAPPANDLISFEPMTAPTDALRAGGFPVAEPGKPYRAVFAIAVHERRQQA
jgi:galactose mutarotase-like enzyme